MTAPIAVPLETVVLPTGCTTDEFYWDMWGVYVRWQGSLGWTVTTRFKDERLSAKGRKWTSYVHKRNRRFYYFPTHEEALSAAMAVVDDQTFMGRTWAETQKARTTDTKEPRP
jgi:hypothetical protein